MSDRAVLMQRFLEKAGWDAAKRALLAGDASNRTYYRLGDYASGESAVLMDAPPEKGEDTRPFVKVARFLTGIGLSAPEVLHTDEENGFLLIEDLGDDLFARVVKLDPQSEKSLYEAATDTLVALHSHAPPVDLSAYSKNVMSDMAVLAFDWYADGAGCGDTRARQELYATMLDVLEEHANDTSVLIQRDYHAENLLWLPQRPSGARVGLLDFQDAMLGHPAYDLVSLLQDARRDVSPELESDMLARFVTATGNDRTAFKAAYACLGAQRNLRIIGVFARLCIRDGKPGYIDFIPRVWGYLQRDLEHPALSPVAACLSTTLPAPTSDILKQLKDRCATPLNP